MKNDDNKSTPLFLICIASYLCFGLLYKFTDWLRGPGQWYHVIFAPIGIIGFVMQIYMFSYLKVKLCKWRLFEDKADTVAFIVVFGCLILYYFGFGFGD